MAIAVCCYSAHLICFTNRFECFFCARVLVDILQAHLCRPGDTCERHNIRELWQQPIEVCCYIAWMHTGHRLWLKQQPCQCSGGRISHRTNHFACMQRGPAHACAHMDTSCSTMHNAIAVCLDTWLHAYACMYHLPIPLQHQP